MRPFVQNQFDRDSQELGWRVAMLLWIENRGPAGPGYMTGPAGAQEYARRFW